mgnify:CR=1 FL=1
MATGGIGGLYQHSTNFSLMTGDACRIAEEHSVALEHMDYVQIHPTCLYSTKPGRSFLISESARGEGAVIQNHKGERFVENAILLHKINHCRVFHNGDIFKLIHM